MIQVKTKFLFLQLQENLLNIGSELDEELEAKLAMELEQNLEQNVGQNLEQNLDCSLLQQGESEGNPLIASQGLTDCTVKNEITNHIAKLQENARGKSDILKLLQWPREGMM